MMPDQNEIMSSKPVFDEVTIEKILNDSRLVLRSGVLTDGPYVKKFEQAFAEYVGTKEAIAVNSGTCSLEIAFRHYGVKGGEVIVPTNTFIASANTVFFAGGNQYSLT